MRDSIAAYIDNFKWHLFRYGDERSELEENYCRDGIAGYLYTMPWDVEADEKEALIEIAELFINDKNEMIHKTAQEAIINLMYPTKATKRYKLGPDHE